MIKIVLSLLSILVFISSFAFFSTDDNFQYICGASGLVMIVCLSVYVFLSVRERNERNSFKEIKIPDRHLKDSRTALSSWHIPQNQKDAYETIVSYTEEIISLYDEMSSLKIAHEEKIEDLNKVVRKKISEAGDMRDKYMKEIRKNSAFHEFAHIVSGSRNVKRLYRLAAENLKDEFHCKSAFVMKIENGVFKLAENVGEITDATIRSLEISGLLDSVLQSGLAVRLGAEDAEAIKAVMREGHDLITNLVCVPLITKNEQKAFGAIGIVNNQSEEDFTEEDEEFLKLLGLEAAIAIKNLVYVNQLETTYEETMLCLAQALEGRDKYTHGHVDRVRDFSEKLALAMGLSDEEVKLIRRAATLHDVGKIATPDSILHKQSRLTDDEWSVMRHHAEMSAKILEPISSLPREVIAMVRAHHERWDGSGYPHRLSKKGIPRGAQIIAVADAFDAMTSDRPYRKGLSYESALAKLKRESIGTQFDPEIITPFLLMMHDELSQRKKRTAFDREGVSRGQDGTITQLSITSAS